MSRAEPAQLTALEHLHELLKRTLLSVAIMFVGGGVAFIFRLEIIKFLQRPLNEQLYYTSPAGSFQFIMQVCLVCGFILAVPILLYNIIRFVEPAFSKRLTRKMICTLLGSSFALVIVGVCFGYFVSLPPALRFFGHIGTESLQPLISVNQYFSFVLGYLSMFAAVFQLPLILLFINRIRPIKPGTFGKARKFVIVGAFGISVVLPASPDPLSQLILATPIIVLYELTVVAIRLINRRRRLRAASKRKVTPKVTRVEDLPSELPASVLEDEQEDRIPQPALSITPLQPAFAPVPVSGPTIRPRTIPVQRARSMDGFVRGRNAVMRSAPRTTETPRTRAVDTPQMSNFTSLRKQNLISDVM